MLVRGATVGRYLVQRKLAEGGMAEIYLASAIGAEGFTKEVALKVVRPFLASDPQFVQMFIAEARLASRLNHANVVQIFDFGKHDQTYYLAMELVRGATLSDLRKRCRSVGVPFPPVLAAEICAQVARGLQYAHDLSDDGQKLGVVHRDLSPHNVLLSFDGAVKLTDFGIAKATASRTAPGVLKGKYAYMSPEQGRGDKVDARTDIFALGIVLWEVLTGSRLFGGDTEIGILRAVQQSVIPEPAKVDPNVPKELSDIAMKALARNADERFQTAFELERALSTFVIKRVHSVEDTSVGLFLRQMFREELAGNSSASQQAVLSHTADDAERDRKRAAQTRAHTPLKPEPERATPQPLARAALVKTEPAGDLQARQTDQNPALPPGPDSRLKPFVLPEAQPGLPRFGTRPGPGVEPVLATPSSTPSRRLEFAVAQPARAQPVATKLERGASAPGAPLQKLEAPPPVARRSKAPVLVVCVAALGLGGGLSVWALRRTPAEHRVVQVIAVKFVEEPPTALSEAPPPQPSAPVAAAEPASGAMAGEAKPEATTSGAKPAEGTPAPADTPTLAEPAGDALLEPPRLPAPREEAAPARAQTPRERSSKKAPAQPARGPAPGDRGVVELRCPQVVCALEIDGKPAGETPKRNLHLEAGLHTAVFINSETNDSVTRSLNVKPGERLKVSVDW